MALELLSQVICVIAQRLVRVICKECKSFYEPTEEELSGIGVTLAQLKDGQIAIGTGCSYCFDTGYVGRTAIYEILTITDVVREGVLARHGASAIKEKALEQGLKTLRMDGARKVIDCVTTVEEVLRMTQLDLS